MSMSVLKDLPAVRQPLRGVDLKMHFGRPADGAVFLPKDVLRVIVGYLTAPEAECLRAHGLLLEATGIRCETVCGCSLACSHPANWRYDKIALLSSYQRTSDGHDPSTLVRRHVWRFDPPIFLAGEAYTSLLVTMTPRETAVVNPSTDAVLWSCSGASCHFLSLFIKRGFDIVMGPDANISSKRRGPARHVESDLSMLYAELLVAKKEAGYDVPYISGSIGAECPSALADKLGSSLTACLSCQQKGWMARQTKVNPISHHWQSTLSQRLLSVRQLILGGASVEELEQLGLTLRTPGTRKSLSRLNQDADILARAISWRATQFLRNAAHTIDFTPGRSGSLGCPIYYVTTVLASLATTLSTPALSPLPQHHHDPLVQLTLDLLPSGILNLTPGCHARRESFGAVREGIHALLQAAPQCAEEIRSGHAHLYQAQDAECVWCQALETGEKEGRKT
ncbi:hypothetical protein DIPPA_12413 [Diplonema papillatum]|nr:hypothetical protein DIPPA_12413 [Diplonema papillatum]